MFESEREMQNKFVELISNQTNTFIFEEVGNMDSHFRIDVVKYTNRKIIAYELKLKDYKKAFNQAWKLRANKLVNKSYVVLPEDYYRKNKEKILHFRNLYYQHIGILTVDKEKIRNIKKAEEYNFESIFDSIVVRDLIIKGFHKNGINKRKSYR